MKFLSSTVLRNQTRQKTKTNETKVKGLKRDLVFSIGVVLVNRPEEMVALEQRTDVSALAGGERHGQSVKRIELLANRLVKQQENQKRRFLRRALQATIHRGSRRRRRRRRRIDLVDGIRENRHSSTSVPVLQPR